MKWNFAIGTTSRVPGTSWHYLLMDVDGCYRDDALRILGIVSRKYFSEAVMQKTANGWHLYSNIEFPSIESMILESVNLGSDPVWAHIALKRGYAFLADKHPLPLPWPVERMVIGK